MSEKARPIQSAELSWLRFSNRRMAMRSTAGLTGRAQLPNTTSAKTQTASTLAVGRTPWSAADAPVGPARALPDAIVVPAAGRGRPARTRGSAPRQIPNLQYTRLQRQ